MSTIKKGQYMRIAIPVTEGRVSEHFGHSEQFLFVDADMEQRRVLQKKVETAPEHAPGRLPRWLGEHVVDVVITPTLGERARDVLTANAVEIFSGVSGTDPDVLTEELLNGRLEKGANRCNHSGHSCGH